MAGGDSPSAGDLDGFTTTLGQMTADVPLDALDVVRLNAVAVNEVTNKLRDEVLNHLQAAAQTAGGLFVDESAVGRFNSAIDTATNLTASGDAIKEYLSASQRASAALREFISEAVNKLHQQQRSLGG